MLYFGTSVFGVENTGTSCYRERVDRNLLYGFLDFRSFLKQFLVSEPLSLRSLSIEIGLKSPAPLSLVLSGKRPLSRKLAIKLAASLFSQDQHATEYFLSLVEMNQCEDKNYRNFLKERLRQMKPRKKMKEIPTYEPELVFSLTAEIMKELLNLGDKPSESLKNILGKMKTPPSPSEAERLMRAMEVHGLVKKISPEEYAPAGDSGLLKRPIENTTIRQMLVDRLNYIAQAPQWTQSGEGKFTTLMFPMKKSSMGRAKHLIDAFWKDFADLLEETPADAIYLLGVQFFPVTR